MARVRSITPGQQNVTWHQSEVDCFHQMAATPDGELLLHLSTFGSDSRESEPKSSQSLQLDRLHALKLASIIGQTFLAAEDPDANVLGKQVLRPWVVEALTNLGGEARLIDVCREVWRLHETDLQSAGDLLYTWQYDIRWAATMLRHDGILIPANAQVGGRWQLSS